VSKGPLAFRTISETADALGVQQHVLRFWETKFTFIRPTKRAGGRRFYRPQDVHLLEGVKILLHEKGYTIRGVQMLFREQGQKAILSAQHLTPNLDGAVDDEVGNEDVETVEVPVLDPQVVYRLSQENREKFLNIARMLESAQASLGVSLNRSQDRGKFS
jgi:DNA-binding transcriptional MerR regulator